jgi:hypothetical protein
MATKASWFDYIPWPSDDPAHPSQVALRTYALALSLSLGPALIPFITSAFTGRKSACTNTTALKRLLKRELNHEGFAFAITLSVGGGATLQHFWNRSDTRSSVHFLERPLHSLHTTEKSEDTEVRARSKTLRMSGHVTRVVKDRMKSITMTPEQRTFIANVIASSAGILLLQQGREKASRHKRRPMAPISPTVDLTLLFVVRALDSLVQSFIHAQSGLRQRLPTAEPKLMRTSLEKECRGGKVFDERLATKVDAMLFWACSARCVLSTTISNV